MRTIKLELVRHGPPHNQLLSPLTPYLALCENHPPVTVHVPFEHNQCLYRLQDVHEASRARRGIGAPPAEFQLIDMGRTLGMLLGQIPGLVAEISREPLRGNESIHLRLILSSSELALLPFECAISPEGLPGTGLPLALQSDVPVCITREVRRTLHHQLGHRTWRTTRILFAWAAPPDVPQVPHEAHLLALRTAIDPWCTEGHVPITVLPQASIQDIEAECRSGSYTHVHILAHGVQARDSFDYHYALALHDDRDPRQRDEVQGERLATALRACCDASGREAGKPFAVTIASCHGSTQGSVAGVGASIAHALHVEGIPIVIATQFPRCFVASVRMVEILYDHMLWGKDPRLAVSELRRQLYAELPGSYEWASVTGYLEFEQDYACYVPFYRLNAVCHTEPLHTLRKSVAEKPRENTVARLEDARDRLLDLYNTHFTRGSEPEEDAHKPFFREQAAQLMSWLAFVYEMIAYAKESEGTHDKMTEALRAAHDALRRSLAHGASEPRAMIKLLWISAILGRTGDHADEEDEWQPADVWGMAHAIETHLVANGSAKARAGARQDLLMLHLVRLVLARDPGRGSGASANERALHYAKVLWADVSQWAEDSERPEKWRRADVSRSTCAEEMKEVVERYLRQFGVANPGRALPDMKEILTTLGTGPAAMGAPGATSP